MIATKARRSLSIRQKIGSSLLPNRKISRAGPTAWRWSGSRSLRAHRTGFAEPLPVRVAQIRRPGATDQPEAKGDKTEHHGQAHRHLGAAAIVPRVGFDRAQQRALAELAVQEMAADQRAGAQPLPGVVT